MVLLGPQLSSHRFSFCYQVFSTGARGKSVCLSGLSINKRNALLISEGPLTRSQSHSQNSTTMTWKPRVGSCPESMGHTQSHGLTGSLPRVH